MDLIGTLQVASSQVSTKNRNSVLPIHLQEARDEKGRKRLHGAFTGGFSAGYFNTVGSKEGWQPSTFSSTRSARVAVKQRPEDFMDDEDIGDVESSKKIATTVEFDVVGGTEKEMKRKQAIMESVEKKDGILSSRVVEDLIVPSNDPIGIKLLRKMGWRYGQGVGPRVKQSQSDDIHASDVLFAPRDITAVIITARVGRFGLGFDRYHDAPEFNSKGLKEPNSGGFGTGVLDEEDDDEVYSTNVVGDYNMVIDDDENSFRPESQKSYLGPVVKKTGFDGKAPLPGFCISSIQFALKEKFDTPKTPANYVPKEKFRNPNISNRNEEDPILIADQRRDILGEAKLDGPTRSVFSFFGKSERDKLDRFINQNTNNKAPVEAPIPEVPVDKSTALAALKGFLPFANDQEKNNRYKKFLELKAEITEVPIKHPPYFSKRDIAHEILEFSKSAHIYKPLSAMMASRFTSASAESESKPVVETLAEKKVEKNYGLETRTIVEFIPHRILCKRFNIANPFKKAKKGESINQEEDEKEVLNEKAMLGLKSMVDENKSADMEILQPMIEENDIEVPDEPERPPIDVFKAIFADSDNESDSEDEDVEKADALKLPPPTFRPLFTRKDDHLSQKTKMIQNAKSNVPVMQFSRKEDRLKAKEKEQVTKEKESVEIVNIPSIPDIPESKIDVAETLNLDTPIEEPIILVADEAIKAMKEYEKSNPQSAEEIFVVEKPKKFTPAPWAAVLFESNTDDPNAKEKKSRKKRRKSGKQDNSHSKDFVQPTTGSSSTFKTRPRAADFL